MREIATGAAAALAMVAAEAHAQPDLTGVWQLASPPLALPGQIYPDLPFTEEGREKVMAHRALVDPMGQTPGMFCVPAGMPEMMMGVASYPIEVIQKEDQVTIISENLGDVRRIFLGDRIVGDAEIFPDRNGYSRGHWEGEVLVVETTHLEEQVDSRYPHSAATTITERFSLTEDADGTPRLLADTVVTDPEWLTEPLEYRLEWTPYEIGWIQPFDCTEQVWLDHLDALARGERGATGLLDGSFQ